MSAKGRGRRSSTDPLEFHETPAWCVHRLIEAVDTWPSSILDPCAGEGAILRAFSLVLPGVMFGAIELRSGCSDALLENDNLRSLWCGNFLSHPPDNEYGCVVANPPFSQTEAFVEHALKFAPEAFFLQRLNWLSSRRRVQWLRERLRCIYVLPDRTSFSGDGKTDATAYAWLHFTRQPVVLTEARFLRATPPAERRMRSEREQRGQLVLFEVTNGEDRDPSV